jgi:hypothetical protein
MYIASFRTRSFQHKHNYYGTQRIRFYSTDIPTQRAFFDRLVNQLKIQNPEDWYSVKPQTVIDLGGSFVQSEYNGSLLKGNEM